LFQNTGDVPAGRTELITSFLGTGVKPLE